MEGYTNNSNTNTGDDGGAFVANPIHPPSSSSSPLQRPSLPQSPRARPSNTPTAAAATTVVPKHKDTVVNGTIGYAARDAGQPNHVAVGGDGEFSVFVANDDDGVDTGSHSSGLLGRSPSDVDEGRGCRHYLANVFRINVVGISLVCVTAAVVVTAACVMAVQSMYFLDSAESMAHRTSSMVAAVCTSEVTNALSRAAAAGDAIQYRVRSSKAMPLPRDLSPQRSQSYCAGPGPSPIDELIPLDNCDSDPLVWRDLWMPEAVGYSKDVDTVINQVAFGFVDYSYVACVRSALRGEVALGCVHVNPLPEANVTAIDNGNGSAIDLGPNQIISAYDTSGNPMTAPVYNAPHYDTRQRPWYKDIADYAERHAPITKYWGAFTMPSYVGQSSASLSLSLVNRSGYFLGVAKIGIEFNALEDVFAILKPTKNTVGILLDRNNKILSTSTGQDGYTLSMPSAEELATKITEDSHCEIRNVGVMGSDGGYSAIEHDYRKICQSTIEDLGYQPLISLATSMGHMLSPEYANAVNVSENAPNRLVLDGEKIWVTVQPIRPQLADDIGWKLLVFVPESDLTGDVLRSLYISVGISAAIVIAVVVLVVIAVGRALLPLTAITREMQSATYLQGGDSSSSEGTEGGEGGLSDGENDPKRHEQRGRAPRKPSYLSDVAAIQRAYWTMVDELRALRGYIPQHVCEEVIESARRTTALSTMSKAERQRLSLSNGLDRSQHQHHRHQRSSHQPDGGRMSDAHNTLAAAVSAGADGVDLHIGNSHHQHNQSGDAAMYSPANTGGEGASLLPPPLQSTANITDQNNAEDGGRAANGSFQLPNTNPNSDQEMVAGVFLVAGTASSAHPCAISTPEVSDADARAPVVGVVLPTAVPVSEEKLATLHGGARESSLSTGEGGGVSTSIVAPPLRHPENKRHAAVNNNNTNTMTAPMAANDPLRHASSAPVEVEKQQQQQLSQSQVEHQQDRAVPPPDVEDVVSTTTEVRRPETAFNLFSYAKRDIKRNAAASPQVPPVGGRKDPKDKSNAINTNTNNNNNNATGKANNSNTTSSGKNTIVYFRDSCLVDRSISVACVNIVEFHQYAVVTHGADVTRHHEALVAYLSSAATRCGGVLDTFSGDKFWVSFNATAKCDHSQVAAAAFALEVSMTINREAAAARAALVDERRRRLNNDPVDNRYKARFPAALLGVTVGLATGRAFVGPLGTSTIRRHSIISNAMSEAAALERLVVHYPGCSVMVGGDMIPAIEGYFQYLVLDAMPLPGSHGKRRRIASLGGAMCAPGKDPALLQGITTLQDAFTSKSSSASPPPPSAAAVANRTFPKSNPFDEVNSLFNAFLEGRTSESAPTITRLTNHASTKGSGLSSSQRTAMIVMLQFLHLMIFGDPTDGRQYTSGFGRLYERKGYY